MLQSVKKSIKKLLGIKTVSRIDELKSRGMKVGSNFFMFGECIIDGGHAWLIEIGDNVTLAPRVYILAHDASTKIYLDHSKIKKVKIGNNVFIGGCAIIMPGVTIGNDVIIGAGSVVTKNVPDNSVYAGNPARFLAHTDTYIADQKKLMKNKNTFGKEYTLAQNISEQKKEEMKKALDEEGMGFIF